MVKNSIRKFKHTRRSKLVRRLNKGQRRNNNSKTRRYQRGGGKYNYSLYAYLPEMVATAIKSTTGELQRKYSDYLKWTTNHESDPPHITITYGPSIDNDEITKKEQIDGVYPGLSAFESKGLPEIVYKDVNIFTMDKFYVIKVSWHSDLIIEISKYIYDTIPEVKATSNNYSRKDGFEGRLLEYFENRIHTTLCVLDREKVDAVGNLESIIADAKAIYESKAVPSSFLAKNISLISAISDTPILLW